MYEGIVEQISDGASQIAERLRRPISRVRFTIHTWTGHLAPSGADTLTAVESFTRAATAPRTVVLASGIDQLQSKHVSVRVHGWATRSSGDNEAEDLAILEEFDREDRERWKKT